MKYYAHTAAGGQERWEPLQEHLQNAAARAGEFASAFGASDWGWVAGMWHDLGKYSAEFQAYLRKSHDPDAGEESLGGGRVDHSTFGAQYAAKSLSPHMGQMMAFCIAGHHAGLTDGVAMEGSNQTSSLKMRLMAGPPRVPRAQLPADLPPAPKLRLPFVPDRSNAAFQVAFFTRMLFSCLVDADRIATEAFCDPAQSAERARPKPTMVSLRDALARALGAKQAKARSSSVNKLRAKALADCLEASALPPGIFSLNVPTGGGKTLSSLAFALNHAVRHQLRRVVMGIPFTSIIEQTADVYRQALGDLAEGALIEHHSNLDPKRDTRAAKLATENWDAPLIVTTNVQLFESLFASATTPCRKLHRLAKSVIVLDEAQTLPVELLLPTLAALKELVEHYGCTLVLCTATQPALQWRPKEFEIGFKNVRPIVDDEASLFAALKRVEIVHLGKMDDEQLADRLAQESAALCIVNSRPHAARLYDALVQRVGKEGCYHLSTYLCAQHRREKLAEIRQRLEEKKPCRLISTQLIEAGVDVDFPAVYRAPAGFDSVAQAAGRCNREGRQALGRVYLFETESPPPPGLLRAAAQTAKELMGFYPDPIAPDAIEAYFRQFYWSQQQQWDKCRVLEALYDDLTSPQLIIKFRTASQRYKIIREEQNSILVPHDEKAKEIRNLLMRTSEVDFFTLRRAQPYLVGVRNELLQKLIDNQLVIQHECGLWYLTNESAYSEDKGLSITEAGLGAEVSVI